MFERQQYHCPLCGCGIRQDLPDGAAFACPVCGGRFRVVRGDPTAEPIFVEQAPPAPDRPLGLPKGSIRATIALAMAFSCWALIFMDRPVPGCLLSLVLTIVGYYFGFRTTAAVTHDRAYDAAARRMRPLYLPGGAVRLILVAGFAAAGICLAATGKLAEMPYLEFVVVLAGLIAGHLFGRAFRKSRGMGLYRVGGHVVGLLGLGVAGYLTAAFVTGTYGQTSPHLLVALCALISFYFGSRS